MGSNPNNNNNNNRQRLGNIINRVFESAGPDGKVRGTPQQIIDKYQGLARDAQLAGDRVAAESFLQHSEHYSRMLGEAQAQQNEARQAYDRDDGPRDDGRRDDDARRDGFDQPRPPRPEHAPQPARPDHQQPAQHQPQSQPPLSSGLAMIDPTEDGEFGGPIDTPESSPRPAPADTALNGVNGAHHSTAGGPVQEEPAREAAPKRSRPRRKARPDGETSGETPPQQPE